MKDLDFGNGKKKCINQTSMRYAKRNKCNTWFVNYNEFVLNRSKSYYGLIQFPQLGAETRISIFCFSIEVLYLTKCFAL